MFKNIIITILVILLGISIYLYVKPDKSLWFVSFENANTRLTYDDYHHLSEARAIATGKGVKVGIMDVYFGLEKNQNLYAGGKDFTGDISGLNSIGEHGLWMATTLKEIAPGVQVYALNCRGKGEERDANSIVAAIEWAIDNKIDILTYSAESFSPAVRAKIDGAVQKAIASNIITTFIHYDLEENILPYSFYSESNEGYKRAADIRIFHFDYNVLLLKKYSDFVKDGKKKTNHIGSLPYFSLSSMSPVLAGIIAMMKELNPQLTAAQCKQTLIATSYEAEYDGHKVARTADALKALQSIMEHPQPN